MLAYVNSYSLCPNITNKMDNMEFMKCAKDSIYCKVSISFSAHHKLNAYTECSKECEKSTTNDQFMSKKIICIESIKFYSIDGMCPTIRLAEFQDAIDAPMLMCNHQNKKYCKVVIFNLTVVLSCKSFFRELELFFSFK
jgi:hypothetical protein